MEEDYGMEISLTPHNLNVLVLVSGGSEVPGHGDLDVWLVLGGKNTLGKVNPVLYYLMS